MYYNKLHLNRVEIYLLLLICLISCKTKSTTTVKTNSDLDELATKKTTFDWTGTYTLADNELLYTLKLHKRSVDGSYEIQFYNNGKYSEIYKTSIYDVKEVDDKISIRFLNNFQMDFNKLNLKSGDTLFILQEINDGVIHCEFRSFHPAQNETKLHKKSADYY